MPRRPRESTAKGHGSPPLQVAVIDPVDEHPVLGPLRLAKAKKLIKKTKGKGKTKVKVDVKVQAEAGEKEG